MATFPAISSVGTFEKEVYSFDSSDDFPAVGVEDVIYIAKDIETLYYWDGSTSSYHVAAGSGGGAGGGTIAPDTLLGRNGVAPGAVEQLTPAEVRTMLNVADGATANSSDATLLARANHTGTQLAATISDLGATVQGIVTSMGVSNQITVQDEGATQSGVVTTLNFAGAGVTAVGGGNTVTVTIPGPGAATITVKEGDGLVSNEISTIDFGPGFDVTESPTGEANVALDLSEYTGAALPIASGGTGATSASAARTALGLATVAASGSAADLTGNLPVARLNGGTGADATTYWRGDGTWGTPPGGGGGGATNLSFTRDATTLTVLSDTGTDANLPAATSSLAGLLSAADKVLLDAAAPLIPGVTTVSGTSLTLDSTHNGKIIRFTSGSAITVTVPTAFSGMSCAFEWQDATGTISVVTSGTTINGVGTTVVLSASRGMASLLPTGSANAFDLQGAIGDLASTDITDSSSVGRSVLTAVDAAAARTAIGVVLGTDAQPYSAVLTTLAGASADGQSLVTAANYAAMKVLLDLEIGTDVQAYSAVLTTLAAASANGQSLVTAADYAAMRTLLGLVPGTSVQAYDAELAAIAGLTSAADQVPYFTGSGTAALATVTSAARTVLDDATTDDMLDTLGAAPLFTTVTTDTTTARTLAASDNGTVIRFTNGSAITVTVPTAFDGMAVRLIKAGAGAITLSASGTTINNNSTLTQTGAWGTLLPTGTTNTFDLIGQTGAAPAGTVTSVDVTGPAAGIIVTGVPITTAGTVELELADDLLALENLSGTGFAQRTGASTWAVGDIDLASDVTGDLPVTNLDGGTSASASTFWRGDGTWATPAGAGDVTLAGAQTFTGTKTFAASGIKINGSTSGAITLAAPATAGSGTVTFPASGTLLSNAAVTVANAGTGSFDMTVAHNGTMTAGRTLTFNVNDAARSISLTGNLTLAGNLTTSGAFASTFTLTGTTTVTFPTSGTLATLAGSESLSNKTLPSPRITTGINDTNGNELLLVTATASAVNEITLANAATGNNPSFTASGGDTNVGINVVPKGTGQFQYNGSEVGLRLMPQNSRSAAYTLTLSDRCGHIYHPSADTTARIWTIPANSSVAYPIGTTLTFVNDTGAGAITIAITTDTLVMAGTGSTGSRTLAASGVATALKVTSTRWVINGVGLS